LVDVISKLTSGILLTDNFEPPKIPEALRKAVDFHPAVEWQWLRSADQLAAAYPRLEGDAFHFETAPHLAAAHHLPSPEEKESPVEAELDFRVASYNPGSLKASVTKKNKRARATARRELFVA
ncbi:unnamed protein product, partial [Prorocentrum cordatum]